MFKGSGTTRTSHPGNHASRQLKTLPGGAK